jgi:hypothetical protein
MLVQYTLNYLAADYPIFSLSVIFGYVWNPLEHLVSLFNLSICLSLCVTAQKPFNLFSWSWVLESFEELLNIFKFHFNWTILTSTLHEDLRTSLHMFQTNVEKKKNI